MLYFLKFLEDCMQENPEIDFNSLLQSITFSQGDILNDLKVQLTWYSELTNLKDHDKWNEVHDKVVYNHYDFRYGHCLSIDIYPLYGLVPQNKNDEITMLKIKTANSTTMGKLRIYDVSQND